MAKTSNTVVAIVPPKPDYHFFGPPGVTLMSLGLPLLTYAFLFLCNDATGCPAPSLLHPSTLTWDKLKEEVGWQGWSTIYNVESLWASLGWYGLSLVLYAILPAGEYEGTPLVHSGTRLKYRMNIWPTSLFISAILIAGTIAQGAEFPVWTFISDNFVQLFTANLIISFSLATFVYIRSFAIDATNPGIRELAHGGNTGNIIYDWFIGRELNPRIKLPFIPEVDIKVWMEIRPGLLGWLVIDAAMIAKQYRNYGYVTDSIVLTFIAQAWYVFDSFYMEPAILTTIDIVTDGFGFMLSFGDVAWVPFVYSLQSRYLATYPVHLGYFAAVWFAVLGSGYYIFRGTNNEKNRFRNNPNDPKIAHLKFIETKAGTKLLVSGWWGRARHINYLGDWLLSWAYCIPTGLAGYQIVKSAAMPIGVPSEGKTMFGIQDALTVAYPGEAKGWGMIVTYFFMVYFAVLLIHRERRDEAKCRAKYGKDWDEYCKRVPWRIIPYVY